MQAQVDRIESTVKEIHEALIGTSYNDNGIIKRMKKLESYQQNDEKQKWIVAGVALTIGAISKFSKEIVSFFS